MAVALTVPDVPPFTPDVVAQIDSLEDAASTVQDFIEHVTRYLDELKDALDTDLATINAALP